MKNLKPIEAWAEIQHNPDALLIDVRMEIESLYVGRPPGAVNIAWYEYPELSADPVSFTAQVLHEAGRKDRAIYLICRSGKRTVDAANALEATGFSNVTNILEGFEGELDQQFHRSSLSGWRHAGLPWEQM